MPKVPDNVILTRRIARVFACMLVFSVVSCQQPATQQRTENKTGGKTGSGDPDSGPGIKSGKDKNSCFNVVNGADTSEYPGVVLILMSKSGNVSSSCTGFFVGPNTMLTASHCVDPSKFDGFLVSSVSRLPRGAGLPKGFKPSKVIAPRIVTSATNADDRAYDVAAMVFASDVAPGVVELAGESPAAGETATVVGYGQTNVDNGGVIENALQKRYGKNEVGEAKNGIITFVGPMFDNGLSPEDKGSGGAPGDSGGPLFVDGKVVGVVSGGSGQPTEDTVVNVYADVTHTHTREILHKAKDAGGKVSSAATDSDDEPAEEDQSDTGEDAAGSSGEDDCL
jgi:V8-like Glu-specific endopeptidase